MLAGIEALLGAHSREAAPLSSEWPWLQFSVDTNRRVWQGERRQTGEEDDTMLIDTSERRNEGGLIFSTSSPAVFKAWALDHDIPHKDVLGCYKGERERAFFVPQGHVRDVFEADWLLGEESALFLTAEGPRYEPRQAFLLFLREGAGGSVIRDIQPLGAFRHVQESEALALAAWTYDPTNRAYFVAGQPERVEATAA